MRTRPGAAADAADAAAPAIRAADILLRDGNLPIVIWMLFTYFKEIPKDILEAARMDGATRKQELLHVLLPLSPLKTEVGA